MVPNKHKAALKKKKNIFIDLIDIYQKEMDELELLINDEILATISKKLRVNISRCRTRLENVRINYPKKLKAVESASDFARARVLVQLVACAFLDLHGSLDPFKVIEKYTAESFIAATILSCLGIAKGSSNTLLDLLKLGNGSQTLEELTRIHKLGSLFLISMQAARTEAISNVFDRVSSFVTVEPALIQLGIDLGGAEKGIESHVLSLARSFVPRIIASNGKSEFETNRTWMVRFFVHQQDVLKQPLFSSAASQVVLDEVIETPEQLDTFLKVIRDMHFARPSSIKFLLNPNSAHSSLFNLIKGKCLADIQATSITAHRNQFASSPAIKSKASNLALNERSTSLEMSSSIPLTSKPVVATQRVPGFAETSRKLDALHGRSGLGEGSSVNKFEPVNESQHVPLSASVQPAKDKSVPTVNKLKNVLKARSKQQQKA